MSGIMKAQHTHKIAVVKTELIFLFGSMSKPSGCINVPRSVFFQINQSK